MSFISNVGRIKNVTSDTKDEKRVLLNATSIAIMQIVFLGVRNIIYFL